MIGVVVNVSELPLQVGLVPDVNAMDTAGATEAITFIVILFELTDVDPGAVARIMIGLNEVVVPVA